jgi:hypothetical protein
MQQAKMEPAGFFRRIPLLPHQMLTRLTPTADMVVLCVRGLRRLLENAGLQPIYATYWNTLLFPIMALQRLVPRSAERESDVHLYPSPIEALFGALLAGERRLLHVGIRLPFGGSLLAVAKRRDD